MLLLGTWLAFMGYVGAQPNRHGFPMITGYRPSDPAGSRQNRCITQDARGVLYVGTGGTGVREYDGVEWRIIPMAGDQVVYSLITGDDGVVYVGKATGFGYLAPDRTGQMRYHSLSDSIDRERFPIKDVWKIWHRSGKIYFCTFETIFIFDTSTEEMEYLPTSNGAFYSFLVDSALYVSDPDSGLLAFNHNVLETVPGGEAFRGMHITGMERLNNGTLLIGTRNSGLFLLEDTHDRPVHAFPDPELQDYFRKAAVTQMVPVGDQFAVATRDSGMVILDSAGRVTEMITGAEGLIDATVNCIYVNQRAGAGNTLWLAGSTGIFKLETGSPFRVTTAASGLEGTINGISLFNGRLFIATSSGLYFQQSGPSPARFIPVPEAHGKEVGQLMLFRPHRGEEMLIASSEETTWIINRRMNVTRLEEQVLIDSAHRASSREVSGIALVKDPARPNVIYTGPKELTGLEFTRRGWNEVMQTDLGNESFMRMEVDKFGFLWTSTPDRVVRVDISRLSDVTVKFISTENGLPSNEMNRVFLDPDTETVLLGTVDGFYRYDYFMDTIYRDTLLNGIMPEGRNRIRCFYRDIDGDDWLSFENEVSGWTEMVIRREGVGIRMRWDAPFRRLPNLPAVAFCSGREGEVWFGKSSQLCFFDKTKAGNRSHTFRALIRQVTLENDSVLFHGTEFTPDHQPVISTRTNNVRFNWAATFYEKEESTKYSYLLEGSGEDWSAWSPATHMAFNDLHHGKYTLHLRARNVYGEEGLPAAYAFTIRRPWFGTVPALLIYVMVMGMILFRLLKMKKAI